MWSTEDCGASCDGSPATAGSDYLAESGTLTISGWGSQVGYLSVPIRDDDLPEGPEVFWVRVSNPTAGWTVAPGHLGQAGVGRMRIRDDDLSVLAVLDAAPVSDSSGSAATMTFTVRLEDHQGDVTSAGDTVRAYYATDSTSSATEGRSCSVAGADYVAASGELVFAPGETTKTVPVTVCPDSGNEPGEEVRLVLLRDPGPVGAVLGDYIGTGTIPGNRSISINNEGIIEQNGRLWVRVRLSEIATDPVSVMWSTEDCGAAVCDISSWVDVTPATADSDYDANSGTVTIKPGNRVGTFSVKINDDDIWEGMEVFWVRISNPTAGWVIADGHQGQVGVGRMRIRPDSDPQPELDFVLHELSVSEGTTVSLAVTHRQQTERRITVDWTTRPGGSNPATAGSDYTAASGTLTIDAPPRGARFPVQTLLDIDDTVLDIDETFEVILQNPDQALLATAEPTATITMTGPRSADPSTITRLYLRDSCAVEGQPLRISIAAVPLDSDSPQRHQSSHRAHLAGMRQRAPLSWDFYSDADVAILDYDLVFERWVRGHSRGLPPYAPRQCPRRSGVRGSGTPDRSGRDRGRSRKAYRHLNNL